MADEHDEQDGERTTEIHDERRPTEDEGEGRRAAARAREGAGWRRPAGARG